MDNDIKLLIELKEQFVQDLTVECKKTLLTNYFNIYENPELVEDL